MKLHDHDYSGSRLRIQISCQLSARRWLMVAVAVSLVALTGCNRSYYRRQADQDAYATIRGAASDPRWPLQRYRINVDPESRMFSPFAIDCPPMPPDDPTAHRLMHRVDGKRGYPHWHANGDTNHVENPAWEATLPWSEEGTVRVDIDDAVRLALLHAPDYQEELEELYLSALDVSFERFRFDAQFFAGYGVFYTSDGEQRPGSGGEDASELELATVPGSRGIRVNRLYTTGAELVVGLANSLIWQFSGPNTHDATTLLDFTFIQPLLRGAGRDRVMERLTIAERTLLANVRQMERYRREFYLDITTGRNPGPGPERRGGFFGGAGLEGFTGVGGGGFGRVGSGGQGFAGGAGAPEAGGLIGLLQARQNLRNQESNIAALRNSVIQLDAFFQAGRIDYFQVELARQALLNAQSRWLNARAEYESSLDNFKRDLGLPPHIPLEVVDDFLQQFNLIDPALVRLQDELSGQQERIGNEVLRLATAMEGGATSATLRQQMEQITSQLTDVNQLDQKILDELIPLVRKDIQRLREAIPQRRQDLAQVQEKFETPDVSLLLTPASNDGASRSEMADIMRNAFDLERLLALPEQLERSVDQLRARFVQTSQQLDQLVLETETLGSQLDSLASDVRGGRIRSTLIAPLPNQLRDLAGDLLELSLVQARARTESITLLPVDLDWQTALQIARENRRDWMNARANLVDSWRLIQFNANDLESELDIVFSGDIRNQGDNPLRLSDATGRLRAGIQFDAPLTRLSERNTYRQALIEYDQARRNYYQFEDRISEGLRETIRRIELNQLNFELLRSAVRVSIAQVELAQLRLLEPPKPDEENILGATTARDLVTALSDLLNVQTDFLSVWVNYEVLRRGLDLDLGTMQLDPYGGWIDPGPFVGGQGSGAIMDDANEQAPGEHDSINPQPSREDGSAEVEPVIAPEPDAAEPNAALSNKDHRSIQAAPAPQAVPAETSAGDSLQLLPPVPASN